MLKKKTKSMINGLNSKNFNPNWSKFNKININIILNLQVELHRLASDTNTCNGRG